jgi:hypothetical protein
VLEAEPRSVNAHQAAALLAEKVARAICKQEPEARMAAVGGSDPAMMFARHEKSSKG